MIRSDHETLQWILNLKMFSEQLARGRLRLAKFDFDIARRPEKVPRRRSRNIYTAADGVIKKKTRTPMTIFRRTLSLSKYMSQTDFPGNMRTN